MSNLKKYLKVYKEDAKHKKAFAQYMMVISENQDFFTRHEVNEFFTDMIKDGTLVYDEGFFGDVVKKIAIPLTITAALLFAPVKDIKANDVMLKGDVITAKTDSQFFDEITAEFEKYDAEYTEKDSEYHKKIEEAPTEELNKLFIEKYGNELEYYNKIMNFLQKKKIYKLKVSEETRKYYLEQTRDLKIDLEKYRVKSNIDDIIKCFDDTFKVKDIKVN